MRNKVIEIKRIAKVEEWYYVDSAANMIAHILAQEKEVQYKISKKIQIPGFEWMKESENQYPIKSRSEVILTSWEVKEMKDEIP